jgi:hypothetical protein
LALSSNFFVGQVADVPSVKQVGDLPKLLNDSGKQGGGYGA